MRNVRVQFVFEVLAGVVGGFAGLSCGYFLSLVLILLLAWVSLDLTWLMGQLAVVVGGIIGATAGVSLVIVGWCLKAKGNVRSALLGATGGAVIAATITYGAQELWGFGLYEHWLANGSLSAAALSLGATIGYNFRNWRATTESKEK